MNPSGFRIEEKKDDLGYGNPSASGGRLSTESYKSTPSSRSSVLERAREYNRRVEEQNRADETDMSSPNNTSSAEAVESPPQQRSQSLERSRTANDPAARRSQSTGRSTTREQQQQQQQSKPSSPSRSVPSQQRSRQPNDEAGEGQQIVSPELLVDALSGHEDGLLAIAERLMEHYDEGYDVMGEAIIDAFADVQKLFQHVVEAAHMEGAAFEASRRQKEVEDLRRRASVEPGPTPPQNAADASSPRHEEFIDQDVKDVLVQAIRKGTTFREANQHQQCLAVYEEACQEASALLPVDSDYRGKLQLSLARAEAMTAERACAILRYVMDDVVRSSLQPVKPVDVSQRADVVLSKPNGRVTTTEAATGATRTNIVQSSDEALASLTEELRECMGAPVYADTPLQALAPPFWRALEESQQRHVKQAERLEIDLAQLKGEHLMAKAEWEEKLDQSNDKVELYKGKYVRLKEQNRGENYMEQARNFATQISEDGGDHFSSIGGASTPMRSMSRGDNSSTYTPSHSSATGGKRAASVASNMSGFAQHARSLVTSMNCAGLTPPPPSAAATPSAVASPIHSVTAPKSRSFREYPQPTTPKRMDV